MTAALREHNVCYIMHAFSFIQYSYRPRCRGL